MKIRKVACIKVGLIGHSWATSFSSKGLTVNIQDLADVRIAKALSADKGQEYS